MLRRYGSKSLDTIVLKRRCTTIGSADTCDVVIKGKGVSSVHASIESTSSGFYLREQSLSGVTRVNEKTVFGQVQIHSGDLIQVANSTPFVFDSEWIFGSRPSSAVVKQNKIEEEKDEDKDERTILPVIGKKMIPLSQTPPVKPLGYGRRRPGEQSSASSTESTRYQNNVRSMGNNLLQRVVKLQAEVIARDEKIRQLSAMNPFSMSPNPQQQHIFFHPALPHPIQNSSTPPISSQMVSRHTRSSISRPSEQKSFELFAYRGFVSAITAQLRQFNDRVVRTPQRDSAELFTAMARAVDVPLSSRIMEIEKFCEAVLIDNDFEDSDELMGRLDNFIRESRREKIVELTNELEMLMPLIRDAASNARENIKVCNVFTQWSRQFGDLLRKSSFSSSILFQAIDDLKSQFSEAHMSRHWLPPSITPILRLAALELEKRNGDVTPSTSPVLVLERRKSIDMTLDTCICQVETLVHEMDYHVVRLNNKARDYTTFQQLDLDSATRFSKIIESLKSSIGILSEHSFKEEPVRPNSVLFFEITNEDISNSLKNGEGSQSSLRSTGSQSSLKKVSVAPKITDPLSEDDELKEERHQMEEKMNDVIKRIDDVIGNKEEKNEEDVQYSEGVVVSVDAGVLKMLIENSQRLLNSFDSDVRMKRSEAPMIVVENQTPEDVSSEDVTVIPVNNEEGEEEEDVEHPESPQLSETSKSEEAPETPEEAEEPEAVVLAVRPVSAEKVDDVQSTPPTSPVHTAPESPTPTRDSPDSTHVTSDNEDVTSPVEVDVDEEEPVKKNSLVKVMTVPNESKMMKKAFSEDLRRSKDSEVVNESIDDESETEDVHPFNNDDKSTIRYVSKHNESQELSPQNSEAVEVFEGIPEGAICGKPKQNGDVIRESRMSSHLRSHINTANGKPHITYQYPIRKFYSPPMKRRSKSEDQKIKETLSNRPRFVLY